MAAGVLPKPGTKFGPCKGTCEHRDCAATRSQAASACPSCGKPIEYDTRFYQQDDGLWRTRSARAGTVSERICEQCGIRPAGDRGPISPYCTVCDPDGALFISKMGETSNLSPELVSVRNHLIAWLQGHRDILQDAAARHESTEVLAQRIKDESLEQLDEQDAQIMMGFLTAATDDATYQGLGPTRAHGRRPGARRAQTGATVMKTRSTPSDMSEYLAQCISCWNGNHEDCEPLIARGGPNDTMFRCRCAERQHQPAEEL
jgi:hypothetical protein